MSTPYADTDNVASGSRRAPLGAVLRSRSYLVLWTVQFASMLAGFFNYIAVAWLTLQLTGSPLAVGSVLAAAAVPMAVLMLLGGALSDRFSPRSTLLVAGLLVVLLPAAAGASGTSTNNPLADVRDGILHAWADVPLRAMLLVISALNFFAIGAIEVGLPVLAHQRFSQGAVALGTTFAAWGLGSTLGSLGAATRPNPGRFGWVMVGMVALLGAGLAATGVAPALWVLLVVMMFTGVVEGGGTTYVISWMQRRTDPGMQGRVMSLAMLSSVGLEPVALAVAGALASRYLGLLFWGSAVAIELTALAAGLSRSVRRL